MSNYKNLSILILFILASVVADNRILQVFGEQPTFIALVLSTGMLILQTIAAPIQAGFSDFYCRRKSLIVALSCSFLSVILLVFSNHHGLLGFFLIFIIIVLNGALGNVVPLTWSALADTTQEKNLRFFLSMTTGAYAIGYMALAILSMHAIKNIPGQSLLSLADSMPTILFLLSIALCVLTFRDTRDRKLVYTKENMRLGFVNLIHAEFTSLIKDVSSPSTRWGLLSYFLWAASQYSVLILLTDFQTEYTFTIILMMCGYLTGILILGLYKKISDEKMIKAGLIITISALSLFFILNPFFDNDSIALSACYFFYTMSNAFLTSSILSLFSKERELNQQGKGFGLIVSADSGGFLIATVVVIFFHSLKLRLDWIVLFSFGSFLISLYPYVKYAQIRKDIQRE